VLVVAVKRAVNTPVLSPLAVANGSDSNPVPATISKRKLKGISCIGEILIFLINLYLRILQLT
jgi:hypothetical protein